MHLLLYIRQSHRWTHTSRSWGGPVVYLCWFILSMSNVFWYNIYIYISSSCHFAFVHWCLFNVRCIPPSQIDKLFWASHLITYAIHRRCFSMSLALQFVTHKHLVTITKDMYIKMFKSRKISVKNVSYHFPCLVKHRRCCKHTIRVCICFETQQHP